jgi:murein DD-endopeptidase MepM/ murein hydrolase activator NlpD
MERGKHQASIFGGAGFYIALLLCVLAAGVGGYFWLFAGNEAADPASDPPPVTEVENPVTAKPPVEVVNPEPPVKEVEKPVTVVMPERETPPVMATPPVEPEPPALIVSPLAGETVGAFSADMPVYNETTKDWRTHEGVDISAPAGTTVVAAAAGTVQSVAVDDRLGTTVVIAHKDGYVTTYAGLQEEVSVTEGDSVSAGAQVGTVGNTTLTESALGAHLHFAVTKDDVPVDPADYLGQ